MTPHDPHNQDRISALLEQLRVLDGDGQAAWFAQTSEPAHVIAELKAQLSGDETVVPVDDVTLGTPATMDAPASRQPPPGVALNDPDMLGPYKILRRLGEGGFGIVFLAHQEEPIRRQVAVKVVRAGIGGSRVLARFEAERQALALMSHIGVAKVIDAGTMDSGESYFVMEYVDGKPIDEVCDERRVGIAGRIELVIAICEAIQHAHGKGIIHRDLKPGNILVSVDGEKLHPRVIDFGIAKAVDPDLIGTGSVTMEGQFLGTPHYMSPEQTGFTGQDVDVRADVYSLGAVLYELLIGCAPVDRETIQKARDQGGLTELQRVLCERSVGAPSVSYQRMIREAPLMAEDIAEKRKADPRGLQRAMKGDLDWILLRALERDRDRRYATPLEFAADLRRHLNHEPVLAGPPSKIYRFSKFTRRNRAAVTAVFVVFVVLIVAAVYSNAKRLQAERSARETASTLAFVENSFSEVDPSLGAGGRDLLAVDFFAAGFDSIGSSGSLEPAVQARLYALFATVFIALGDYGEAEESARQGLQVFEEFDLSGDERVNENGLRSLLAEALLNQGKQGDAVAVQAGMDSNSAELHDARGMARHNSGDYDAAGWHYSQAITMREESGDSFELAQSLDYYGRLMIDDGALERGRSLIERSASMRERLSETRGSAVAMSLLSLGYAESARGNYERALQYFEEAHELYWQLHKPDVTTMVELCRLEVLGILEDTSVLGEPLQSDIPKPTGALDIGFIEAMLLRNRARMLHRAGASQEALAMLERSLAITAVDPGHRVHTLLIQARIFADLGESDLAIVTLDDAMLVLDGEGATGQEGAGGVLALRAELLLDAGERSSADRELQRLEAIRGVYPEGSPPRQGLEALKMRLKGL